MSARRIRRFGQIALGAIWLVDGALQLQPPMFGRGFITGVILPNAAGQPGFIASPLVWMAHDIQPHVALFNGLAAALQLLIGLALMFRATVKPALAASFIWAAAIWFAGEGFGGLLAGTANPLTGAPGAALLYIMAGAMVWPRQDAGDRIGRPAWALFWLGSAALWLLPGNDAANSAHDAIAAAPSGAGWLTHLLSGAAQAAGGHGTAIALVLAATSVAIGLSSLTRTAEGTFIGLGIGLNLVFWILGQGLGGILTGTATDLATAPLVILVGAILLAETRLAAGTAYAAAPATSPSSPAAGARIAEPSRSLSSAFSPLLRSTR